MLSWKFYLDSLTVLCIGLKKLGMFFAIAGYFLHLRQSHRGIIIFLRELKTLWTTQEAIHICVQNYTIFTQYRSSA